jgi:hypothetical protein
MDHYDEDSRGSPLLDYDDRQECDIAGEDAIMAYDSDSNISSTVDSEDENYEAPRSNWKVFKMTMKGANKTYWYNEVTGKSLWVAPPPNANYVPPTKRTKNIGTMDVFISRPPTGSASYPIGFKVFNDATPAISPPL